MKKYIAVAALIAAGSAFANAENVNQTYTAADWENGTLTLGESFSLSEENWTISFSLDLDPSVGASTWGTRFFYTSSLETPGVNAFFFWLGSNTAGGKDYNYGYVNFRGLGSQSGQADYQLKDSLGNRIALALDTPSAYTFDLIRDGDLMAIEVRDAKGDVIASATDNQWKTPDGMNATIKSFTSGIDSEKQKSWSMPSVTLSTTGIIPEPSAFGMLAGVSALALVASRRRRTKKA